MKTIINMLPISPTPVREATMLASGFNTRLAIETDSAYGFTVMAGANQYRGSMKVLAEETANNAGTRRLLLKIELPLAAQKKDPATDSCCCSQTDVGEIPMVSVHTVITVPKSVAASLIQGDEAAIQHVSIAIRLLQNLVGGLCHSPMDPEAETENGQIAYDGAVVMKDMEQDGGAAVVLPMRFDAPADKFHLDVGVPTNAPIWGMIGGLRRFS